MKKFINKPVLYILGILFIFGIWFLLSVVFDNNSMVFPNPISTFKRMFELLGQGATYKYLAFSIPANPFSLIKELIAIFIFLFICILSRIFFKKLTSMPTCIPLIASI